MQEAQWTINDKKAQMAATKQRLNLASANYDTCVVRTCDPVHWPGSP